MGVGEEDTRRSSETNEFQRGEDASRDQKRTYGFVPNDRLYRYVYETQQRPVKRIKRDGPIENKRYRKKK